ncbi:hypothetical protein F5Y11DRAFT_331491 [Daldinia sp. FL1419]|nr:hypothetical protein F5Y11DRAFT_331491 [Daldinia sp. FL1419]
MLGAENMNSCKRYVASSLDSIWPPVIQSWILCFPCDQAKKKTISHVLKTGLAKTIEQRPYLAGTLGIKDGRLQLVYNDLNKTPVPISINDFTEKPEGFHVSYEGLCRKGAPISHLLPAALEPTVGPDVLKSSPIVAQANFIDGGCLLSICINHGIMDGPPQASIISAWARNCKRQQDDHEGLDIMGGQPTPYISKEPGGNSDTAIRPPDVLQGDATPLAHEEKEIIKQDGKLWQLLGLQKGATGPLVRPTPRNRVTAIFTASRASITRLRESSQDLNADNSEPQISSFDAEAALLWRCIMRARHDDLQPAAEKTSRLRVPVDLRKVLGAPDDFPGNVFLNSVTEIPLDVLAGQEDGRSTAPMIRSSVNKVRDVKVIRDAVKLSRIIPDHGNRRPLFSSTMEQDLVLTSWRNMALCRDDWGPLFSSTGRPDFVRFPAGHRPGICVLLPKRNEGEVEVLIDLEKRQLGRLMGDEEFRQYYELLSA